MLCVLHYTQLIHVLCIRSFFVLRDVFTSGKAHECATVHGGSEIGDKEGEGISPELEF